MQYKTLEKTVLTIREQLSLFEINNKNSVSYHQLELIDWDFADAETNTTTNTFHPYPAKFIPQIPKLPFHLSYDYSNIRKLHE